MRKIGNKIYKRKSKEELKVSQKLNPVVCQ